MMSLYIITMYMYYDTDKCYVLCRMIQPCFVQFKNVIQNKRDAYQYGHVYMYVVYTSTAGYSTAVLGLLRSPNAFDPSVKTRQRARLDSAFFPARLITPSPEAGSSPPCCCPPSLTAERTFACSFAHTHAHTSAVYSVAHCLLYSRPQRKTERERAWRSPLAT